MKKITIITFASLLAISPLFALDVSAEKRQDEYHQNDQQRHDGKYDGHQERIHKSKRGKMDINLAAMPTSLNGTYEIDRFIIKEGDKIILDSDNDFAVADDKGFLTINMTVGKNIALDMVYNMQMVGPAFQNPELGKYAFNYDKKTFTIPYKEGQPISTALSTVGMTVYDHEDVYWQLPFENGKILFLKIEKESDNIMQLTDKPYYKPY